MIDLEEVPKKLEPIVVPDEEPQPRRTGFLFDKWMRFQLLRLRLKLWEQRLIRVWLGIEREMEIVAQHVRHHQRGMDLLQQDVDLRYEAMQLRTDRLHEIQTSRIKAVGKSVADIQQSLPSNWLKKK